MLQISTRLQILATPVSLAVLAATIILTLKSRFKSNKVRLTIFTFGSVLSIGTSIYFSKSVVEIISCITTYCAVVYFVFMISFVRDYVSLVSRHMTFKES